MRQKRIYDNDFIQDALRLVKKGNKTPGAIATSLGIPTSTLRQWIKKHEKNENCFLAPQGNQSDSQKEIMELKRQLADTQLERDILKKAVAIFSKTQK